MGKDSSIQGQLTGEGMLHPRHTLYNTGEEGWNPDAALATKKSEVAENLTCLFSPVSYENWIKVGSQLRCVSAQLPKQRKEKMKHKPPSIVISNENTDCADI